MEKNTMIICAVVAAVIVIGGGIALATMNKGGDNNETSKIGITDIHITTITGIENSRLYVLDKDGKEYELTNHISGQTEIKDTGSVTIYTKNGGWTQDGSGWFLNNDHNVKFKITVKTGAQLGTSSCISGNASIQLTFDKKSNIELKFECSDIS